MLRAVVLAVCLWGVFSAHASAATLYVCGTGGDDARSYATAQTEGTPWATIGRAAWGSTTRASPNAAAAAAAGDTVHICSGTYTYSGSVTGDNFTVLYNPANEGTAGNYITFICDGVCSFDAPDGEYAAIGATGKDYIKWYADRSAGHYWNIQACALTTAPTGCDAEYVMPEQGKGPVVCHNNTGCWVEGAIIDGGPAIDWIDNWNGVRVEQCTSCTFRNLTIRDFTRSAGGGTNHNQSCLTLYGSTDGTYEHLDCSNTGAGVYFKDTGSTQEQSGNRVRYSKFDNAGECFAWSHVTVGSTEDRNFVYQNVCLNSDYGAFSGGAVNDWVYNNTFYNLAASAFIVDPGESSGIRWWNNIVIDSALMLAAQSATWPADTIADAQHNAYQTYTNFYNGSDGNRTFAGFKTAYSGQEAGSPASVDQDPLLVDAAGGDFRICTAAGVPEAGCSGASPAVNLGVDHDDLDGDASTSDTINAGAYLTNTETIGVESTASVSAPVRLRIRGADAPQ